MVGFSRDPGKDAHSIPVLMHRAGYDVVGLNPHAPGSIAGITVVARLADVDGPIDIVDVFRPSDDAGAVARDAVAVRPGAVWLQLGIRSPEAEEICAAARVDYVEDRCIWVEHRRLQSSRPSRRISS